jgi:hypothetical protein
MANAPQLFKDDEQERLGNGYVPDDDELRKITGINAEQEEAHEREATNGASEDIAEREKKASGSEKKSDALAGGLGAAEAASAVTDKLGTGFNPETAVASFAIKSFFQRNKKNAAFGGGAVGIIVFVLFFGFATLVPLKIEHIIKNLQSHFYSTAQNASQKETNKMFQSYVKNYVLPGLSSCKGTTIDLACTPKKVLGTNPVSNMFKTWQNARIENTLAKDYGIEFKKVGKNYYLKGPNTKDILITDFADGKVPDMFESEGFQKFANRNEFRAGVKANLDKALENETKWKKLQIRIQVDRLAEVKYAAKMCVFVCTTKASDARAALNDWRTNARRAFQIKLIEAVDKPRADAIVAILECLADTSCADKADKTSPSTDPAANGELTTALEDTVKTTMVEDAAIAGATPTEISSKTGIPADELSAEADKATSEGIDKYMMRQLLEALLEKTGANDATKAAARASLDAGEKAIPVVGWVDLASQIVTVADHGSAALQKLPYVLNAAAMVQTAMLFTSYADEYKTGNISTPLLYSMLGALSASPRSDQGGTSAESSPLYQNIVDGAQNPSGGNIKCDDSSSLPRGATLCPELKLVYENVLLAALQSFFNGPGSILRTLNEIWQHTLGWVLNKATGLLGSLVSVLSKPEIAAIDSACDAINPGSTASFIDQAKANALLGVLDSTTNNAGHAYCQIRAQIKAIGPLVMKAITQYLFPSPVTANPSGARNFDLLAGGHDVLANKFCEDTLGCQALSPQQVSANQNEQIAYEKTLYGQSSLSSKMFNTDDSNSMISRLALDIPTGSPTNIISNGVASVLKNPFAILVNSFGSIFKPHNAFAAATPQSDPFGVVQYGYPTNDPVFSADPETYWNDHHCDDPNTLTNWRTNDVNSAGDQTATNGCLLLRASVSSAGGLFDSSNLTADEQAGLSGQTDAAASTTTPSSATDTNLASSNPSAQAVLDSCKSGTATGKIKIVCSSLTLLGLPYGDPAHPFYQYLNISNQPSQVGCNAFVDISILRATNGVYRKEYCSQLFATQGVADGNFKKIDLKSVQPGDIVVRQSYCGCTSACRGGHDVLGRYGHVAVVVSYDAATDKIVVSQASSSSHPSAVSDPTTATWSSSNMYGFTYGMQYTGGGL